VTQVAQERTKPNGRVVGIDIIPAQPPKGVSTIQGNFLSPAVQALVKEYLQEFADRDKHVLHNGTQSSGANADDVTALIRGQTSYIDAERTHTAEDLTDGGNEKEGRVVDVSSIPTSNSRGALPVRCLLS
jgi:21S rRNA (uridine2791-2'-O)-methyltransferase